MDTLFLAFANQQSAPLPTLQEEDDALNRLLSPRFKERHFLLHRDSFVTLEKLPSYLTLYREELALFLYSGHADRDHLVLSDGQAQADGIAQMLGQCPNLKLVFLNGCSTEGQVKALLEYGIPIVIASSAPVDDRKATYFSIRFFEALQQQFSIRDAFLMAKGALETAFTGVQPMLQRGPGFKATQAPAWGLFFEEKSEHILDWKLPVKAVAAVESGQYTPNQHLIETLFQSLGDYNEQLKMLNQQNTGLSKISLANKRMAVLNALPAPLGEPLRKLIVPVEQENAGYDKISEARLHQISLAYQTAMELLVYTLLAQLWEAFYDLGQLDISDRQRQRLCTFFSLKKAEREVYELMEIVETIKGVFDRNKIDYFIQELYTISQLANTDQTFAEAIQFLSSLRLQTRQNTLDSTATQYLCKRGEDCLTYLYSKLGFMARYRLATIQGIDVQKYRHRRTPSYNHATVVLHDLLGGFDLSAVTLDKSLDNRSILLINDQNWDYLNLSPFVIDENAFHKDTDVCRLFFFSHYLKAPDLAFYKYVNKPDDVPLEVPGERFVLVREQLDAFAELILQKPLAEL